ncbi:MAG: ribonuclease HI family protein [Deltaproteobacteria bacterium]|nr:ribonuclease HI family protein [Deltaproteobacteria bacterium]
MVLYCDGASRGNPGPAACAYVLFHNDQMIAKQGIALGIETNNVAEYQGLLKGLDASLLHGAAQLTIRSDSELLVRQLNGQYKVRSGHLIPLYQMAREKLKKFKSFIIEHVPREQNTLADALANQALDAMNIRLPSI